MYLSSILWVDFLNISWVFGGVFGFAATEGILATRRWLPKWLVTLLIIVVWGIFVVFPWAYWYFKFFKLDLPYFFVTRSYPHGSIILVIPVVLLLGSIIPATVMKVRAWVIGIPIGILCTVLWIIFQGTYLGMFSLCIFSLTSSLSGLTVWLTRLITRKNQPKAQIATG